jgi:hypothetical protein
VVRVTPEGALLEEFEYSEGFPNGKRREWYENGQLKSDRTVRFEQRSPTSGGLTTVGSSKLWCENGTLQSDSFRAEDGVTGKNEVWNCAGQPIAVATLPFGEARRWTELVGQDETVLTEEGTTAEGGGWVGAHKTYHLSGRPRELENWQDGALHGPYTRWTEGGEVEEEGSYAAGQKIGTWVLVGRGTTTVTEYDASKFMDPKYAAPFMVAIGLQPRPQWPLGDRRVDADKARYYVSEGLVDVTKPINLTPQSPGRPFLTSYWTYPYVEASPRALELLVELGADPKAADSGGHTRLHYCMYSMGSDTLCSVAETQRLIALGLSPNSANSQGDTPLHEVIKPHPYSGGIVSDEKLLQVSNTLLAGGGDPDLLNRAGKSPLMLAVLARKFAIATEMLERSQAPDQVDPRGLNLIHLTFFVELTNSFQLGLSDPVRGFVELAVSKGVDANQPIGDMGTLKDVAEQSGAIDLAQYLAALPAGT